MNFAKTRDYSKPRLIEVGDLVIVYEKHNSLDYIYLGALDIYNNKFGSFHHRDIIGRHFGCKVHSRSSPGYVYILEPTPELWANALNVWLPYLGCDCIFVTYSTATVTCRQGHR